MPIVPAEELFHWIETKHDDKMLKGEATQVAQLLEKFGVGIEPDVRFVGTPCNKTGKVILFPLDRVRNTASSEYRAAALFVHFSALVAAADGEVSPEEERHLEREVETAIPLDPDEKQRLRAHMRWLLIEPPSFAGIKSRLDHISAEGRKRVANFCISMACSDGRIDPGEMKVLSKIYGNLGLDEKLVYSHVHDQAAGGMGDSGPVQVATGATTPSRYVIPKQEAENTCKQSLILDEQRIAELTKMTSEVEKILTGIFQDKEEATAPPVETAEETGKNLFGLDGSHSSLLRILLAQESWPRDDFDKLADEQGLGFPDGALETINDAAYERFGEPILEEDGDIYVNAQLMEGESVSV